MGFSESIARLGLDATGCSLRAGIFGAEPWTDAMRDEIERRMGLDAVDIYGLSEVLGPLLPSLSDEIIDAIRREVEPYRRPLAGTFGRNVRMGVEVALTRFLQGGSDERASRPGGVEGLAGLGVDEISVRGVVAAGSGGGYLAMVQGPDNKTFIVRANARLLDGTVKAVTAEGLVILQEVNDPLSLVKQKEVRKVLRGLEEGK